MVDLQISALGSVQYWLHVVGMRLILCLLLVAFSIAESAAAQARTNADRSMQNWTDPDLGGAIVEGVAKEDFLWLRGSSRNVVRINRETGERAVVATEVVDLLSDGPHLWSLIAISANENVVRDLLDASLPERRISFRGDPIALFTTPGGPGVLTTANALLPTGSGWSRRRLAGAPDPYAHVSPLTGNSLFVGYNRGEWGGGLRRIDTSTGSISIVKEAGDTTCGSRLDPECAPVVGIISDELDKGCVLVGASLAHLSGRYGEVVRVCEDRITPVFADPMPVVPNSLVNRAGQTWPFDSLVVTDGGWVAVGQDRFALADGADVTMGDIPDLRAWAGLQVSDPYHGVIFVEAACCWGSDEFVQYRVVAIPIEP